MRVEFVEKSNGPERLVCDAEIIFDEEGPLAGMKLIGLSLWRAAEGQIFVTFPARSFGTGAERKFWDFLRPVNGNGPEVSRAVKGWIIDAYRARMAA